MVHKLWLLEQKPNATAMSQMLYQYPKRNQYFAQLIIMIHRQCCLWYGHSLDHGWSTQHAALTKISSVATTWKWDFTTISLQCINIQRLWCLLIWVNLTPGIIAVDDTTSGKYVTETIDISGWHDQRSESGPLLNIKTVLSMYGDFHVKDKTAVRTSYL